MSVSPQRTALAWELAKTMSPHLATQLLVGCFMAFPGVAMDILLVKFHWSIGDFGTAALIQGGFGFLGNIFANMRVPSRPNLITDLRISQAFVLVGVAVLYGWELIASTLPFPCHPFTRSIGFACIGFGVGIQAIVNNTKALRTANPSSALMLVAFTFTFGALFFPLVTGSYLATLGIITEHNWKFILVPVFVLAAANTLWPFGLRQSQKIEASQARENEAASKELIHPNNSNTPTPPRALTPYALGFLLFLYMGIEINLTNSIALHGIHMNDFPSSAARFASSALWFGILVSRFGTSIVPLPQSQFQSWTWKGAIPLAISLAAVLFLPLSLVPWFLLILVTGIILGPFYGFIVGQASHFYRGPEIAKHAATIATIGSAGSILMPFLFGKISEQYGLRGGFLFIEVSVLALLACAGALAYFTRKD